MQVSRCGGACGCFVSSLVVVLWFMKGDQTWRCLSISAAGLARLEAGKRWGESGSRGGRSPAAQGGKQFGLPFSFTHTQDTAGEHIHLLLLNIVPQWNMFPSNDAAHTFTEIRSVQCFLLKNFFFFNMFSTGVTWVFSKQSPIVLFTTITRKITRKCKWGADYALASRYEETVKLLVKIIYFWNLSLKFFVFLIQSHLFFGCCFF